jgi:hypothetical protein
MSVARIRLIVAAVLFFGWLSWLGYLAFAKTTPVIVSRSQVMAASRYVVAEVSLDATGALNKNITVIEDLRPVGAPLAGTIEVRNLEQAEVTGGDTRFRDRGHYLLMLSPVSGADNKTFDLTRPPGRIYRPPGSNRVEPGRPWAYVWDNADVRKQFDALVPRP